jgi:quinol monooxygenase YgiN
VILVIVEFDVGAASRPAFDSWVASIIADARHEPGCIDNRYVIDPREPGRGMFVEVWQSRAAVAAHHAHPSHVELFAAGSERWGMRNFTVRTWADAGDCTTRTAERIEELAAGRDTLQRLVRERKAALGVPPAEPPRLAADARLVGWPPRLTQGGR